MNQAFWAWGRGRVVRALACQSRETGFQTSWRLKNKYFKQVNFTWRVITARRDPIEVVPAFKKGRYRPEKKKKKIG